MLSDIYSALSAFIVTVPHGGQVYSITARDLGDLKNVYDAVDLPTRVLSPFHDFEATVTPRTLSGLRVTNEWEVTDMCLWKAATQDTGIGAVSPFAVAYIHAYSALLGENLHITSQAIIERWKFKPAVYPFPRGDSATMYYGILTIINVKELENL